MPTRQTKSSANSDHDLLIEIKTKLDFVHESIKEKQGVFDARLTKIEEKVANNSRFIWMGLGGVAVLEFLLRVIFNH